MLMPLMPLYPPQLCFLSLLFAFLAASLTDTSFYGSPSDYPENYTLGTIVSLTWTKCSGTKRSLKCSAYIARFCSSSVRGETGPGWLILTLHLEVLRCGLVSVHSKDKASFTYDASAERSWISLL